MSDFQPYMDMVATGRSLSVGEAGEAFGLIMSGVVSEAQIAGFLMALRVRGESPDEITGAATAMRDKMRRVKAPEGAIDVVGTGGDAKGTYNISTCTALVVAGSGVPVAKHGNRSVSSRSGAADVLEQLGIAMDADAGAVERALSEAGIAFLFAPAHHAAMRHVVPARKALGVRTIFNVLGPLCNPADVKRLLLGVYSAEMIAPVAQVLANLGVERAWVVHGADGLDELSTTGANQVVEVGPNGMRAFEVSPEDAGVAHASLADLTGGTPEENAAAIRAVLSGEPGAFRDIVVLNAAAALVVAGQAPDLRAGARAAAQSIDEGKAAAALARLTELCGVKADA